MKINIIIKHFLLLATAISTLVLSSCDNAGTSGNQETQQDSTYYHPSTCPNVSHISFFGKPVMLDDSTHIMQQITEIVENDTMLSIDGWVLKVGQVSFRMNIMDDGLSLNSSTQPDDPKMKQVIEYLNSIYGVPEEDEPDNYWWWVGTNEDYPDGMVIRLRPLHFEEGGTVLFFEN